MSPESRSRRKLRTDTVSATKSASASRFRTKPVNV
jgi:hypothetical protein